MAMKSARQLENKYLLLFVDNNKLCNWSIVHWAISNVILDYNIFICMAETK